MKNKPVNQTAVDNFLCTLDMKMKSYEHIRNARMDSVMFGWNGATLRAIIEGIEKAYEDVTE